MSGNCAAFAHNTLQTLGGKCAWERYHCRVWACPESPSNTYNTVLVLPDDSTPFHTATKVVWTTHIRVRWDTHSQRSRPTIVIQSSPTDRVKRWQGLSSLRVTPHLFFFLELKKLFQSVYFSSKLSSDGNKRSSYPGLEHLVEESLLHLIFLSLTVLAFPCQPALWCLTYHVSFYG